MHLIKLLSIQFLAVCSGIVISGGVVAFIVAIGVVPRFAKKTGTQKHVRWYENCITIGGIFGASTLCINYYIPFPKLIVMGLGMCIGVFIGAMAISLAEILDVIPLISRRSHIKNGIPYFVAAIAFGKLAGSLLYLMIPGFFNY